MSVNNTPDPAYVIGHSDASLQRLMIQDQLYRYSTRQLFVAAGISEGIKVLDVGSGAGDVAILVADLVGPSGSVIGVEMNARALETARMRVRAAGLAHVTFVEGDLRTVALDDDFDAVVGRWILMWVADPAAVLHLVASHVRPGGIVAFQDNDFSFGVTTYPQLPLFQQVYQSLISRNQEMQGQGGPEFQMGLKLYKTYLDAGLPAPQLVLDAPIGGGPNWMGYAYIAYTVRILLPALEQMGMATAAEVDVDTLEKRLRDEAVRLNGVITLPVVIGAWARKV